MPYLRGRHAGRHRAQPAGRAQPHERRSDPRDPPRLGRQGCSACTFATPVFDGATEDEIEELLDEAGLPADGQDRRSSTAAPARPFEQEVTVGLHLHAEAAPPGGRQDPRPLDRPLLA